MQNFPRVLFVTPVAFNPFKGGGATYMSLFRGWPKDRIATVHNDSDPTTDEICEKYFVLRSPELDFREPFGWLRRRMAQATPSSSGSPAAAPAGHSVSSSPLKRVRDAVLGDSIPERSEITPALHRWIEEYRPEVLYTILGSNGLMELIDRIRLTYKIPLVVHIMDDWMATAHRRGVFAPFEHVRMTRLIGRLIGDATTTLGISPAMCDTFATRYGRPFESFQFTLEIDRTAGFSKTRLDSAGEPTFLYVGSIFPNAQLQSLTDIAQAAAELNAKGFPCRLRIITSASNIARFGAQLSRHPNIEMTVSSLDEPSFLRTLRDADALLLPVNFDDESVAFIRYSMPTKVPSYLASGTPCLVYGSPDTAQVAYAMDAGWGHVVAQRSMTDLKAGMRRIMTDRDLRVKLNAAALAATRNHDAAIVRPAFQDVLRKAADSYRR